MKLQQFYGTFQVDRYFDVRIFGASDIDAELKKGGEVRKASLGEKAYELLAVFIS